VNGLSTQNGICLTTLIIDETTRTFARNNWS